MFGIHNYASFVAAILVFQLIPGAGALTILNATAQSGVAAGFGAVAGTLSGDLIYMFGAVLGLAALMHAYPIAFGTLQWVGAIYLCWLGVQLLRTSAPTASDTSGAEKSGWLYFRQSCMVSLTNPKVMLFFMAFFPLFLSPNASAATLTVMMAHVTVISFSYQATLVLMGNAVARKLVSLPWARRITTRIGGLALIGFGVKLALNNR